MIGMMRIHILYTEIKVSKLNGSNCKSYLCHATMLDHLVNLLFLLAVTLTLKHREITQVSMSISIFCTIKNALNCRNSEKRLL